MNAVTLEHGNPLFPPSLHCLGDAAPSCLAVLGDSALLKNPAVAVFCSVKAPGSIILQAHDLAQHLKHTAVPVISGFHSPVEREVLRVLLRGHSPLMLCPARSIDKMRVRAEYKAPLEEGRLVFVSPLAGKQRRATVDTAAYRNRVVAALAHSILVAFAQPGGKTEQLCSEAIAWGKSVYTFQHPATLNLVERGAQPETLNSLVVRFTHHTER